MPVLSSTGRRRHAVAAAPVQADASRKAAGMAGWFCEVNTRDGVRGKDFSFLMARPDLGQALLSATWDRCGVDLNSAASLKAAKNRLQNLYYMLAQFQEKGRVKYAQISTLSEVSPAMLADYQTWVDARPGKTVLEVPRQEYGASNPPQDLGRDPFRVPSGPHERPLPRNRGAKDATSETLGPYSDKEPRGSSRCWRTSLSRIIARVPSSTTRGRSVRSSWSRSTCSPVEDGPEKRSNVVLADDRRTLGIRYYKDRNPSDPEKDRDLDMIESRLSAGRLLFFAKEATDAVAASAPRHTR